MLGPLCEQMPSALSADLLIMGTGGVTESGFTNNNSLVVGSERRRIEVAGKVTITCGHTKFGRSAMVPLAPLDVAHVLVSDTGLAPESRSMLKSDGVRIILA